ncbi:MAG: hypothetical protein HYZ00_13960 [Candidatus Hydrogenedentes bacterium]|nr:hypothetical protein [Deltaproteobacteria bacterium]MBI3119794.1 hypothetical protein [Candidatus Hydrogenedentota bacterium]
MNSSKPSGGAVLAVAALIIVGSVPLVSAEATEWGEPGALRWNEKGVLKWNEGRALKWGGEKRRQPTALKWGARGKEAEEEAAAPRMWIYRMDPDTDEIYTTPVIPTPPPAPAPYVETQAVLEPAQPPTTKGYAGRAVPPKMLDEATRTPETARDASDMLAEGGDRFEMRRPRVAAVEEEEDPWELRSPVERKAPSAKKEATPQRDSAETPE